MVLVLAMVVVVMWCGDGGDGGGGARNDGGDDGDRGDIGDGGDGGGDTCQALWYARHCSINSPFKD